MIRVLIVDDQNTIRKYLNMYLSEIPEISIVGLAKNGREAIELVEECQPDIVLMDIEMPLMDGIEATKIISKRFEQTKIILLTAKEETRQLSSALNAGARGYILKTASSNDLSKIIRLTVRGYFQFGPTTKLKNHDRPVFKKAIAEVSSRMHQNTILLDPDTQETISNISQHISKIERNVEFQQDKIYSLLDLYSPRLQKRQPFFSQKNLLNLLFNKIDSNIPKKLTNFQPNTLFGWGFLLGILMAIVLMVISEIAS